MKKKVFATLVVLVISIITATTVYASTVLKISLDGTYNYDEANKVVEILNKERTSRGLKTLSIDYELTKIAQLRAKEASLYFKHERTTLDDLSTLDIVGENLASGASTATEVMNDWMNSDAHRSNILNSIYKSIGVASFETKGGATYWVQVFHTNKSNNNKIFTGTKNLTNQTVNLKSSLVKDIKVFDLQYKKIKVGEEYTIKDASLQNAGWDRVYTTINNNNFKFTSSDKKIATVDSKGVIKGISDGKVTITTSLAGKSVGYEIQVGTIKKEVESLKFTNKEYSMYVGNTLPFSVIVTPNDASSELKWTSSNENVATVDEKGNVTTINPGKTTITVTSSNGKKASFELTVDDLLVERLFITDYMNALNVGETTTIKSQVYPKKATEKVKYTSSNNKVLTVDSNGKVTAIAPGTATIKAETRNSSASAEITVLKKQEEDNQPKEILIDSVSLNCSEITLNVGESFTPQITVFPSNTTEAIRPTWIGFDYRIVEMLSTGKITAKSAGEGTIGVIVGKNNVKATCKVKVIAKDEIERLEFPYIPASITANEIRKMEVNVYPETARDNAKIIWSSSNEAVATINQNGVLFTHSKGETTITVTAANGVKASTTLTIN